MPMTREQFKEMLDEERLALYKRCREGYEDWLRKKKEKKEC